ncbi:MAG: phytanoyl-CoA dioxygenase family protein [Chitinophagales bacterium]|nr:phytanoyl-CoA dioxygenase family protein [Chitinophagales bacterium]
MVAAGKLKDENKEQFFNQYGFIHIKDFISKKKVDLLYKEFSRVHTSIDTSKNQWNSQRDLSLEDSKLVSENILHILETEFEKHFIDYKVLSASFMSKNPIKGSTCELHRDFTVFDESMVQYRNFWIPLIDINLENGALYVIPGSHQLFKDIRPMFADWSYEYLKNDLMQFAKSVYPHKGDLILYADKMLHGSWENFTSSPRPVIHGGVLPPQTTLYYNRFKDDKVIKYKVDLDFFSAGKFEDDEFLKKYPIVENYHFQVEDISMQHIIEIIQPLYNELT